jgi:hypothetical protein
LVDELVGAVTVVGVVVVGAAELDDVDVPEVEVPPEVVVVTRLPAEPAEVDVVVVGVAADEWAVVSDATSTPSPTAAAVAATPISAVSRRTRAIARSRARPADWSSPGCRFPCAICSPFAKASIGNYVPNGVWPFSTGC